MPHRKLSRGHPLWQKYALMEQRRKNRQHQSGWSVSSSSQEEGETDGREDSPIFLSQRARSKLNPSTTTKKTKKEKKKQPKKRKKKQAKSKQPASSSSIIDDDADNSERPSVTTKKPPLNLAVSADMVTNNSPTMDFDNLVTNNSPTMDFDNYWDLPDDDQAQQEFWECGRCTFYNTKMTATQCEICSTQRDVVVGILNNNVGFPRKRGYSQMINDDIELFADPNNNHNEVNRVVVRSTMRKKPKAILPYSFDIEEFAKFIAEYYRGTDPLLTRRMTLPLIGPCIMDLSFVSAFNFVVAKHELIKIKQSPEVSRQPRLEIVDNGQEQRAAEIFTAIHQDLTQKIDREYQSYRDDICAAILTSTAVNNDDIVRLVAEWALPPKEQFVSYHSDKSPGAVLRDNKDKTRTHTWFVEKQCGSCGKLYKHSCRMIPKQIYQERPVWQIQHLFCGVCKTEVAVFECEECMNARQCQGRGPYRSFLHEYDFLDKDDDDLYLFTFKPQPCSGFSLICSGCRNKRRWTDGICGGHCRSCFCADCE